MFFMNSNIYVLLLINFMGHYAQRIRLGMRIQCIFTVKIFSCTLQKWRITVIYHTYAMYRFFILFNDFSRYFSVKFLYRYVYFIAVEIEKYFFRVSHYGTHCNTSYICNNIDFSYC
jgi:hypothetical protein